MNLTDELRKLAELHEQGHLSDQEFAAAKSRLLATPIGAPAAQPTSVSAGRSAPPEIEEKHYWSSRWSSGNLFFRDRLTIATDGITFRKGAMFSSNEEHINYRAVASFKISNGLFLANISIETSGGSQPIFVSGLWKSDAREIQETIRLFQRAA